MILNRKSAKSTSRVSLFVALAMISVVFAVVQTQGFQIDAITENGAQMCKAGFVELVSFLLW